MRNKKSQTEDLLQFVFIVIVMLFIVTIFSFKGISKKILTKEAIDFETLVQDSSGLLANYFRIPFSGIKDANIADAINIYFLTNDENILKQIYGLTNEFFSRSVIETESSSWSLEIVYPGRKSITIESQKSKSEYPIRIEISNIVIPAYNNQPIKVRLFQTQKDERTSGLL